MDFDSNPCLYRLRYECVGNVTDFCQVNPNKSQKATMLKIIPQHLKIGSENVRVLGDQQVSIQVFMKEKVDAPRPALPHFGL